MSYIHVIDSGSPHNYFPGTLALAFLFESLTELSVTELMYM